MRLVIVVLPAPVEPTKAIFWPRLGVEREVLQNHPVRRIAKADVVEPHVAVQRLERDVGDGGGHTRPKRPVLPAHSVSVPSLFSRTLTSSTVPSSISGLFPP